MQTILVHMNPPPLPLLPCMKRVHASITDHSYVSMTQFLFHLHTKKKPSPSVPCVQRAGGPYVTGVLMAPRFRAPTLTPSADPQ